MRCLLFFLTFLAMSWSVSAQKMIRYESTKINGENCIVNSSDVQFMIFSFGKNYRQLSTDKVFLRDAIHSVIFRGVPSCNVKPLYRKPQGKWTGDEKKFWKDFFGVKDVGSWEKNKKSVPLVNYATFSSESGSPTPNTVTKEGKYMKIGIPIRVQREALRDYLVQEGIDVY